ncbi:MAG: hypothetical protein EHM43_06300 [Ignavibacteriae bacterium]|nr:MAG: hypothetical protein EHM43_06300 [Ignavibacteriota bacterium]
MVDGQFEIGTDTSYAVYDDAWKWQGKILCRPDMYWDTTINNGIYVVNTNDGRLDRLVLDGEDHIRHVAEGQGSYAYVTDRSGFKVVWLDHNSSKRRTLDLPDSIRPGRSRGEFLVSDSVVVVFSYERKGDFSQRVGHAWWNGTHEWSRCYEEPLIFGQLVDATCLDDSTFIVCNAGGEWGGGLHYLKFDGAGRLVKRTLNDGQYTRLELATPGSRWAAGGLFHLHGILNNNIVVVSNETLQLIATYTDRTRFVHSGVELTKNHVISDVSYADSALYIAIKKVGILRVPTRGTEILLDSSVDLDTIAVLPPEHRESIHDEGSAITNLTRTKLRIANDGAGGLIFLIHGRGLWWIRDIESQPVYARFRDPFGEK